VVVDLQDLAVLPRRGIKRVSQPLQRPRCPCAEPGPERLQQSLQGLIGTERPVAGIHRDQVDLHASQFLGPRCFGLDARQLGCRQPRRRAALAGQFQLRPAARFHDQRPRRNQGCQFRVAKLLQQPEHVAVQGLLPNVLPRIEMTADAHGVDAGIECGGVQGQQAALAPTHDADLRIPLAGLLDKPIDARQHLLQLVPNQVPAQLER